MSAGLFNDIIRTVVESLEAGPRAGKVSRRRAMLAGAMTVIIVAMISAAILKDARTALEFRLAVIGLLVLVSVYWFARRVRPAVASGSAEEAAGAMAPATPPESESRATPQDATTAEQRRLDANQDARTALESGSVHENRAADVWDEHHRRQEAIRNPTASPGAPKPGLQHSGLSAQDFVKYLLSSAMFFLLGYLAARILAVELLALAARRVPGWTAGDTEFIAGIVNEPMFVIICGPLCSLSTVPLLAALAIRLNRLAWASPGRLIALFAVLGFLSGLLLYWPLQILLVLGAAL